MRQTQRLERILKLAIQQFGVKIDETDEMMERTENKPHEIGTKVAMPHKLESSTKIAVQTLTKPNTRLTAHVGSQKQLKAPKITSTLHKTN